MTLLSIIIGKKGNTIENTIILSGVFHLNKYNYFQKKGMKELCIFSARNSIFYSEHNKFENIKHKEIYLTMLRKSNNLVVCAILDNQKYPIRVLHRVINKIYMEYLEEYPEKWKTIHSDFNLPMKDLNEKIILYQDPSKADKLHAIECELKETKEIMYKNIEKVLERGVKIDTLVEKSRDLSLSSKKFYKQSKNLNRCCVIV